MIDLNNLGFMYIAEQVSPENYEIKNMDVHHEHGICWLEFDAILHTFQELNRNKRQYLRSNVEDCVTHDPKIQAQLKDNAWFGEQDHPTAFYKNSPLTPERMKLIKMDNTSHKIMNPKFIDDYLMAHIQTDSGCAAGMNMYRKTLQGMVPGFSCRAMARLKLLNGIPTVIIQRLITYDWVLYRSHARAHNITDPQYKQKLASYTTESTSDDMAIELKELLIHSGHRNPSTEIIMEAFELDDDCIAGITNDRNQIILNDGDNIIYTNLDPVVKRNINSYLSSLGK